MWSHVRKKVNVHFLHLKVDKFIIYRKIIPIFFKKRSPVEEIFVSGKPSSEIGLSTLQIKVSPPSNNILFQPRLWNYNWAPLIFFAAEKNVLA